MVYKSSITALATTIIISGSVAAARLAPRPADNALQHPFGVSSSSSNRHVQAHGRFLHLTDIHMDHHFEYMATIKSDCHRQPRKHRKKKLRKGKLAGYWGAPTSDCDAAPWLVYHALDRISSEWKDKIDFVVWTGDNARHDSDRKIPRTKKEIFRLNQEITNLMRDSFRLDSNNQTIPIVPCIGNNDVYPHNELQPTGDGELNDVLEKYSEMWSDFIPFDQQDVFRKGGYFAVDVAPGIRVLSLNTLYFFNSNGAVNGCDKDGASRDHLQWIKEQLERARRERARVYMIGHIPPSSRTFYPSCLASYVNLSLEYQDIVAGHMYGHLNFDHFLVLRKGKDGDQDDDDDAVEQPIHLTADGEILHATKNVEKYVAKLRRQYRKKASINNAVVVHVAPPLLPIYNPAFRVNQYETDMTSANFGIWKSYTQYYTDLAYWNQLALDHPDDEKPAPQFKEEYSTDATYGMQDLSQESWLALAHRMTRNSEKSRNLWDVYVKNIFVQTNQDA